MGKHHILPSFFCFPQMIIYVSATRHCLETPPSVKFEYFKIQNLCVCVCLREAACKAREAFLSHRIKFEFQSSGDKDRRRQWGQHRIVLGNASQLKFRFIFELI